MKPEYIAFICVGIVIFIALVAVFCYLSNNLLTLSRYKISDERIKGSVRIVQLSDLHGKSFGKNNSRLIKKVAAQTPDIIAITGDIIHKYREKDISCAHELVRNLSEIAPVLYVSGNHEMRSVKYRTLKRALEEAGATVLDDECVQICGLNVCGVNCASIKSGKYFSLPTQGYNVLLAHLPQYISRYSAAGYDLALCGHAHGGQWRIPVFKQGFYSPGQGLFPKYTSGVHCCGNMKEIISRGLGNSECPLRLFNRPEIVVATIENE